MFSPFVSSILYSAEEKMPTGSKGAATYQLKKDTKKLELKTGKGFRI
jgi:hypothetical protein